MTKQDDAGTRFPFINLKKAIERARQLYAADQRGRPIPVPTAFAAWDYSDKSSGGHQTVAALKMYGLLEDSGANEDRRVNLSQSAIHYFAEEREEQRAILLQKFAIKPKLISAIWNDWNASPPADNVARSELKVGRKLNEQSARSFLGIYKDNIVFAELIEIDLTQTEGSNANAASQGNRSHSKAKVGDLIQWEPDGITKFSSPKRVRAVSPDSLWVFIEGSETGIPINEIQIQDAKASAEQGDIIDTNTPPIMAFETSGQGPGIRRDIFTLDEGEVIITWPSELSKESFDDLEGWMEIQLRKIKRHITD